jgi:Chaperone of endosialidase
VVDSTGHLGVAASSQRFKKDIQDMGAASEAILALRPVTFHYKSAIDPAGAPQFGLVAEEVAKVSPDLVVRDAQNQVFSVRYSAVNAMLLNEFQKQHERVEEQAKTIAEQAAQSEQQKKEIAALRARVDQFAAIAARVEALEKLAAVK